jgi:CBS domain-containing protein
VIVEEIMERDVATVIPEASLKDVAALLVSRRIAGVPVCEDGVVVGVVSEQDILWKELGVPESGGLVDRVLAGAYGDDRRMSALSAGDAMSAPAVTVDAHESVAAAARLMVSRRVNRLPVLSGGRLVGIVTRADLVRAFARSDEEIEREIADVLETTLWVDPGSLSLAVDGGAVRIAGRVENRTTAGLIEASIHRVPGVVGLSSELTWKIDDLARRVAGSADRLPARL